MGSSEKAPLDEEPASSSSSSAATNTTSTNRRMLSDSRVFPNAIPPRTSSTGLHHGFSAIIGSPPRTAASVSAVLNPVSEGKWLQSSAKGKQPEQPPKHSRQHSRQHSRHQSSHQHPQIPLQTQLLQQQPQPPPRKQSIRKPGPGLIIMQHQNSPLGSPDPSRFATEDFTFSNRNTWTDDKERVVRGPYQYVVSHPGKDFRAHVIAAFNAVLEVPPKTLETITRVVGMLHESSLLVDDVQDSSELRRGFPVAHNIFGVAQTINSANYMYFNALQELLSLNNNQLISTFAEELVNLHRGQGMDLFWRDTLTCPTEDDYLEMVGNKTGGLFRLGIKLMQAESTAPFDCVPLVDIIGLIFQIRDDYMNLNSNEYSHNKGMCEDLTEGKFSFPVIHSIRADPTDLQLINILKQKPTDLQVKRYAVSYMESKGSFEYTRQVVNTLIERARKMADELDQGWGKVAGIHKILDKMVIP